jgi:hypothetical protein
MHNAVFFLQEFAPQVLEELKGRFPELADEMTASQLGGEGDEDGLDKARAEFHITNLHTATQLMQKEVTQIKLRIKSAKRYQLAGKIVTLLSTSGVLGALAFGAKLTAVIGGLLTWLASIGELLAGYKANSGVIKAYPAMYMGIQTAKDKHHELTLAVKYGDSSKLQAAINDANEAAAELYRLLAEMGSGFTHSDANTKSLAQ